MTKFRAPGCGGSPRTKASKRDTPVKRRYFAVIGSYSVKAVEDRYRNAAYHNKQWQQAFYARKQLLLSARLSHRNSVRLSVCLSVCPSVTRMDRSKTVQARITKSYHRLPGRLVLRTVKLPHKFEGCHPNKGAKWGGWAKFEIFSQ